MPAIAIQRFDLPDDAKIKGGKSASDMVEAAFAALYPWFAGIIPAIETEWQRGATAKDDRTRAELRLGGLAGEVSTMKDLLQGYVNQELRAKPPIVIEDFKLPEDATTKNDDKNKNQLLTAPVMSAKAFQALTPWFGKIIWKIKPYYRASAATSNNQLDTSVRLGRLAGQVNVMKDLLERYVNKEIAKKEGRTFGFSGGSSGSGEEVEIAPEIGYQMLDFMDVEVGENNEIEIIEDVTVELVDDQN